MTQQVVQLDGHLTRIGLDAVLAVVGVHNDVIIDCRTMSGYDLDARHAFAAWSKRHDGRVAVVTPRPAWHMLISTMALATRRSIKAFDDVDGARAWLST